MLAALSASWRVHGARAARSETQTSSWSHHVSALSQAAPLNLHGYGQNGRGWLGGGLPRVKRGGAWRAVTAGCRLHGVAWTSCMASSTPCHAWETLFARSTKCMEFVRPTWCTLTGVYNLAKDRPRTTDGAHRIGTCANTSGRLVLRDNFVAFDKTLSAGASTRRHF
jgi:hypothetical protein